MFCNSQIPEKVPHNFMMMKRDSGNEAIMNNPNNQGIPYDSISMTMMITIMELFNKQQNNDITIRRDYKKIINNIMLRTRKSLSSSTSSIIPSRDDGPRFKSSSSPGKRVSRSSRATDRSQRHDTSLQGRRTSHNSNKKQQAPIEPGSHCCMTGFHVSARTRNTGSSFHSPSTSNKSLSVSWSDRFSVTMFDMNKSPTDIAASIGPMYGRNDETATETLVFPPLPFVVGPTDDTRETRTSGASVTPGGAHSTSGSSSMFDVDKSATKSTTSTCQMYWQKNDRTTTGPKIFPPLPFAVERSDDIQGTRTSGASISPGGAHSASWSSSSDNEEKGIDNGGDKRGEDPKEGEDQDDVFPEVAATQKTTAQPYSKHLSSLIKTSTSPRNLSFLPGYSLGQLPKHRSHMVIPTMREAGVEYASTLQPLDFAFVLRSDGYWTYGIVCDIIGPNGEGDIVGVGSQGNQQSIRFAFNLHGSNKTIHKKNWGHKIRLINGDHEKNCFASAMA